MAPAKRNNSGFQWPKMIHTPEERAVEGLQGWMRTCSVGVPLASLLQASPGFSLGPFTRGQETWRDWVGIGL